MIEKKEFLETYLEDSSGLEPGSAEAVYLPENEKEAANVLRECFEKRTPVTVSGARTGLAGGAVPHGGIVLSTERLRKIEIRKDTALVQAGATLSMLETALDGTGLFYPPDPTEKNAAIGGTIATDASGGRSFYYGRTRNYVVALKVALADGTILNIRRGQLAERGGVIDLSGKKIPCASYSMPGVKSAAGYYSKKGMDAVDLFAGSEGTLGIVCAAELRLLEKPRFITLAAFFSGGSPVEITEKLKEPRLDVVSIEYFDENSLDLLKREFNMLPSGSKFALFIEKKGSNLDDVAAVLESQPGTEEVFVAEDRKRIELFRNLRHRVPEKINETARARGFRKIAPDLVSPAGKFREIFDFYKNTLKASGVSFAVFGHIAENHLHINMMPENNGQYITAQGVYDALVKKIVSCGGSVSGEHGIGKTKTGYLKMMYGEDIIRKMFLTRKAADERLLLGRGNIFGNI